MALTYTVTISFADSFDKSRLPEIAGLLDALSTHLNDCHDDAECLDDGSVDWEETETGTKMVSKWSKE